MNRRDLYRYGTIVLGNAVALALAVPGMAYLLDPIRRKSKSGGFQKMAKLSELKPGEPKSVTVIAERTDAWVKYPEEPVGSVWLVRQADEGGKPKVVAFTAECPHLGCAVNLSADGKTFLCPCHTSAFTFEGAPMNKVPPRPMDALEVELSDDDDPEVRVLFQRFRALEEAKVPLA